MDRPITFRKLAAGHYRNDETGVEIVKVPKKSIGRNGWRVAGWSVTAPSYSNGWGSRSEVGFATTKAAAEAGDATRVALATREQVAADYATAAAEEIDRAARHVDASDRPAARSEIADQRLLNARQAWYGKDYDRARTWAKLAVEAHQEWVAEQHTEAIEIEQIRNWFARHGLTAPDADAILAARDADHDEAIATDLYTDTMADARRTQKFLDAAYRHPAYSEARPTRSHAAAMLAGQRALVDEAHTRALIFTRLSVYGEVRGDECRAPVNGLACARPDRHWEADTLGHAPVRYPKGTSEYATFRAELLPELGKWARGEEPYPFKVT